MAFSPDGTTMAYITDFMGYHPLRMLDLNTGKETEPIPNLRGPNKVNRLTFSPDGRLLATVGDEMMVRIWELATGVEKAVLAGHTGRITAVAFSPDDQLLATAGMDQVIRVFEMKKTIPGITVVSQPGQSEGQTPARPIDDVDVPPIAATPPNPEAYAVIIGVEKYHQAAIPAVEFAAHDAQTVFDYLTRAMGFDPKNVLLLKDDQASKAEMEKSLGVWLRNRVTRKSHVLVYYAGHGAPNAETGQPFLVPYDGEPEYIDDTGYSLSRLYENLARLPAQDVRVVLDACFTGQGGRSLIAKGTRPLVTVRDDVSTVGANTVVIAATGGKHISTSYSDGQHGLLTQFLLKGLRGEADADGDGQVKTAELFRYLKPLVEKEALKRNVHQSPTITPALEVLGEKGSRVWIKFK
jgi:hypothetical protein